MTHPFHLQMLQDEDVVGSESEDEDDRLQELDLLAQINKLNVNENGEMNNNSCEESDNGPAFSRASSKILLRSNPVFEMSRKSSKCQKVLDIVNKVLSDSSDKVVVVSQWTSVLDILARFLTREKYPFVELTGKTPIKLRNDIVVNFNNSATPQRVSQSIRLH